MSAVRMGANSVKVVLKLSHKHVVWRKYLFAFERCECVYPCHPSVSCLESRVPHMIYLLSFFPFLSKRFNQLVFFNVSIFLNL